MRSTRVTLVSLYRREVRRWWWCCGGEGGEGGGVVVEVVRTLLLHKESGVVEKRGEGEGEAREEGPYGAFASRGRFLRI